MSRTGWTQVSYMIPKLETNDNPARGAFELYSWNLTALVAGYLWLIGEGEKGGGDQNPN